MKDNFKILQSETVNIQGANALKVMIEILSKQHSLDKNKKITIYLLYRDCTSPKQLFVDSLEQAIQNENAEDLIFLGDININLLNPHESADYLNMCMANGCLSLQNSPTRNENCLDHVSSNGNSLDITCEILQEQITDHAMIDVGINLPNTYQTSEKSRLQFTNEKKFQIELRKQNWEWVEEAGKNYCTSVNDDLQKIIKTIQACRTRATKTVTVKNKKTLR